MTEQPNIHETKEDHMITLEAKASAILQRRKFPELPGGLQFEAVVDDIKKQKTQWVLSVDFLHRLKTYGVPEDDITKIQNTVIANIQSSDVVYLENEDAIELTETLYAYYDLTIGKITDAGKTGSVNTCFYIRHTDEFPPSMRGHTIVSEIYVSNELLNKISHELGHAAAIDTLFSKISPPNQLPKPTPPTNPQDSDPDGYLEYISSPEEIDVRVRAAMRYLSDTWNPQKRPAGETEITRLREAGRWDLPGDVRALRNYFDDTSLLWLLNSMPAI